MKESGNNSFLQRIANPVQARMFLLRYLPSAYFSGLKIKDADLNTCTVSVPYKWFTRNPFGSTYFACLSMAGEMSTGVLAMAHTYKRSPAISMLVVKVVSEYFKKATAVTYFTCSEGALVRNAISEAIATGEPRTCTLTSIGVNEKGERIAAFEVTWTFKARGVNRET